MLGAFAQGHWSSRWLLRAFARGHWSSGSNEKGFGGAKGRGMDGSEAGESAFEIALRQRIKSKAL